LNKWNPPDLSGGAVISNKSRRIYSPKGKDKPELKILK
jgi:hypothetical protein